MELNLRVMLLLVMALFIFGILFESLRRKRQRKLHDKKETPLDMKTREEADNIIKNNETIPYKHNLSHSAMIEKEVNSEIPYLQAVTEKDLIVFYIMPKTNHAFNGHALKESCSMAGFKFSPMKIFDYHDPKHENNGLLFCLSSAFEPGTFDIEHMGSCDYTGLCLFMSIRHKNAMMVFDIMLKKANDLTYALQACLCDNKHEPSDDNYISQCRKRIDDFGLTKVS